MRNFLIRMLITALGGAIAVSIMTMFAGWLVKPSLDDRLRSAFRR